tara:strand:+ start:69081 stop:69587 length:507 start_codon:yes stop_codon:yes gene_type:complete
MAEVLRPRFRYYVPLSQEEIRSTFNDCFKDPKVVFTGTTLNYHIVIDYPEEKRHFWSPQIDLNLEKYEDGTLIRGLIGPRPNVWTVFMFFNAIAGFLGIVGIIIGIGQWSMEGPPQALWLIPLSLVIFAIVYYSGLTGKKIAHEESIKLHQFLQTHLKDYTELEIDEI